MKGNDITGKIDTSKVDEESNRTGKYLGKYNRLLFLFWVLKIYVNVKSKNYNIYDVILNVCKCNTYKDNIEEGEKRVLKVNINSKWTVKKQPLKKH